MSPTIPSVLVLLLLLLPPTAPTKEMMNPFALIRKTLKYWRKVYNTYEEEMTLGYCWAEYFLQFGQNMKDDPMLHLMIHDHSHAGSTKDKDHVKEVIENAFFREPQKGLLLPEDRLQRNIRRKRSNGTFNDRSINIGNIFNHFERTTRAASENRESVRFMDQGHCDHNVDIDYNLGMIDNRRRTVYDSRRDRKCKLVGANHVEKFLSTYVPSLNIFYQRGRKILGHLFDSELKESQTEDDQEFSGKSKGFEVDMRHKVLYSRMRRGTSSSFPRTFLRKVPCHECRKSLDARLYSPGKISPLNDLQFIVSDITKSFNDNKNRGNFHRGRNFDSLNPNFDRAEQRLGTFEKRYRRNLRRERDANHQMVNRPVWSVSKYAKVTPYDEYSKFSFLSSYTIPTKSHTERTRKRRRRLENLQRIRMHPASTEPSILTKNPSILRLPSNYVLPKNPAMFREEKRENNWELGDASKQLLTENRNRYQRTEHFVLPRKSATEAAGKKMPIQYLVGRPSLLSVSHQRFMGDYGNSTSGTSRNSRLSRSSRAKDQGRASYKTVAARGLAGSLTTLFNIRSTFMAFLRTLGFFVQVGREIMDYVESNTALACTKDYLWGKVINWIDS